MGLDEQVGKEVSFYRSDEADPFCSGVLEKDDQGYYVMKEGERFPVRGEISNEPKSFSIITERKGDDLYSKASVGVGFFIYDINYDDVKKPQVGWAHLVYKIFSEQRRILRNNPTIPSIETTFTGIPRLLDDHRRPKTKDEIFIRPEN